MGWGGKNGGSHKLSWGRKTEGVINLVGGKLKELGGG